MRQPFATKTARVASYYNSGQLVHETTVADAILVREDVSGVKRRKPVGFLEPTNYAFERLEYKRDVGRTSYQNNYQAPSEYRGCVGGGTEDCRFNSINGWDETHHTVDSSDFSSLNNSALIKVRSKVKDSAVNYGQALAERSQTARLVGDTCFDLVSMYRALRKGDGSKLIHIAGKYKPLSQREVHNLKRVAGRVAQGASSRWLEIQYGWKPLLSDVYGSIENLEKRPKEDFYYTERARKSRAISSSREIHAPFATGVCDVKGHLTSRYIVIGVPRNEPLGFASQMGLTNPLLLSWELLPFSFVVDWFWPVGNYLDSLDAHLNFEEKYVVLTNFAKIEWESKGMGSLPPTGPGWWGEKLSADYLGYRKQTYLKRTVSSGLPNPQLPALKNPFSFAHMANGLALLTQVFGSKRTTVR